MSKNSALKKQQQLGMPHGTATNRLRKLIIFDLLKQLNKHYCFQCGAEIESIDELSIEHKVPYLDSDDAIHLYFDIGNIAFSHLKCNVNAARDTRSVKHPSETSYNKGCRCEGCRIAKAESWKKFKRVRGAA